MGCEAEIGFENARRDPSRPIPAADAASGWPGRPRFTQFPERKKRLWFTLGLLVVWRLAT